jgi:hypothetical protein
MTVLTAFHVLLKCQHNGNTILGPAVFLITLFSNTLSLRVKIPHQYRKADKNIVVLIVVFIFLVCG